MTFEVESTTYAYYKTGAGYVLWKMFGPDNTLKGHLFHVCRDQRVEEDRVEYLDLLLDLWLDTDGHMTILDRDEVEACAASGVIGEQDLAWIARQEQEITENWKEIQVFDAVVFLPLVPADVKEVSLQPVVWS